MIDKDILFIFGAPRSGTTYLNAQLRTYFDCGLCAEGLWVQPFAKRLHKYGNLQQEANLRRLIDDVRGEYMFEHFRTIYADLVGRPIDVTVENIIEHLPERSYAGVVYAVFASVAEQLGKKIVGNKCPGYWSSLPQLHDWFPNAKFLHVIRDGRDVALSTMREEWGARSVYVCAQWWVAVQETVEAFRTSRPDAALYTLHYEQFLADPAAGAAQLERILGQPMPTERKTAFLEAAVQNDRRANFNKWRTRMSTDDQRIYEAVAGDWLDRLGYETTCTDPEVSWIERAYFSGHELNRKVKRTLFSFISRAVVVNI